MLKPTPILLMVRALDVGGSERQLVEVAKSLDKSRFEVHVGCFHPEGLRGDELRAAGVPIVKVPVTSFRSFSALAGARQLTRYIREHRIRMVHAFDVPATIFAALSVKLYSANTIVLSSQRAHRELVSGPLRRLLRLTDRVADGVVVNCYSIQRHLIQDEGVSASIIHVCRNGVNADEFSRGPAVRPTALQDASLVIGVVCALRPEKRLDTLIDAFARISPAFPHVRLAIVGSGSELGTLQALASSLGVSGKCVFEPSTTRVADWLRIIDIFVLPSRSEALSNSLMEAMSCGCAVVASRVGGNVELVEDGRTGLLFESGDSAGLAAALQRLIESAALRYKLAAAGAHLMREQFSTAKSVRRMAGIYEAVMSAHKSAAFVSPADSGIVAGTGADAAASSGTP